MGFHNRIHHLPIFPTRNRHILLHILHHILHHILPILHIFFHSLLLLLQLQLMIQLWLVLVRHYFECFLKLIKLLILLQSIKLRVLLSFNFYFVFWIDIPKINSQYIDHFFLRKFNEVNFLSNFWENFCINQKFNNLVIKYYNSFNK